MPAQQRGETTKAHIINAAVETFALNGYDATGVAEICKTAGTSKGAFYHHFPSKQTLYLELLNEWLANIDSQLRRIKDQASSVPDALLNMIKVFKSIFLTSQNQIHIFFEFFIKAARDPEVRKAAVEPYRRYHTFFSQLIEQGITDGTIRSSDPQKLAQIIVSLAVGLVMQGMLNPENTDWGTEAEESVKHFIQQYVERA